MTITDCFELGHISKTHGVKGEVVFFLDVDVPQEYEDLDSVFFEIKNELVPYFIDDIQVRGNKAIVKLEDVDTWEQANALVKTRLFLPLDNLPELGDDQFYYHDIIGYSVVDAQKGALGTVSSVYAMPQGDLLVMDYQAKEVLIPINDTNIGTANHEARTLTVNLPDGLLEMYLEE